MVLIGTCGTGGIGTEEYTKGPLRFLELDDTFYRHAYPAFAQQLHRRGRRLRESAPKLRVCNKLPRDLRGLKPLLLKDRLRY